MLRSIISLMIVILFWKYQLIAADCIVPRENKTRVYFTFSHYQAEKISFNPTSEGWIGSNVEFKTTIDNLQKNTFITKDSGFIRSLRLSGIQIKKVEEGAFISLTCLDELFLDHNNINELKINVFQSLDALELLDLSYNKLDILIDLSFSNLANLKTLDLGNNRIKTIETRAFSNLALLEYLNLEMNNIGKISDQTFQPLSNLIRLVLSWNKLWEITPGRWSGLNKLQDLELAGNNLNHFDASYNFSFSSLRNLNLSFNSLTALDVQDIATHLPQLKNIDLNHNPWLCRDLQDIINKFGALKIIVASGKFPSFGINGVACSKVRDAAWDAMTKTAKPEEWVDRNELERLVEKKIRDNNEEIKSSLESLRALVMFVFALLCVFVIIELVYRTHICGMLINKLRRKNDIFIDNSADLENFTLLHR